MSTKKISNTKIIHHTYKAPGGFSSFSIPIHHASTVLFKDVEAMRSRKWQSKTAYTYGLHGTPTSFTLEARLAEIEEANFCLLTPSGLAAISLVDLALLSYGDEVLIPDNAYGPNSELAEWLSNKFGISVRYYASGIGSEIAQLITEKTKLIWVEVPGSVSMEMADVPAICKAAKERGVLVAIDNTWSAGLAFQPFDHGVDISVQALTKYQSGGSDVLMGAVLCRDEDLSLKLQLAHLNLGYGVGMDDVYMVLRNLTSMKLRFQAHDQSARKVAQWLSERSEICQVLHPALPGAPGYELWKRDFEGAGGLFSVLFDERFTEEQTDAFVNQLKLFKIGFSWGGANSLCVPYRIEKMRHFWSSKGILVRFNIGLEDPEDLIADIEQSLNCMNKLTP
jgi:cystathionine beta-lyase